MTEIAHVPPETAPDERRERFGWVTDNWLVRAVGRVRLPLGAKLLIGFAVVGTLLATGYVLGFVALGQSNSRSEQLRGLQERATYAQLLESNAALLASQVGMVVSAVFLSLAYHAIMWIYLGLSAGLYAAVRAHEPAFRVRFGWRDVSFILGADFVLIAFIAVYLRLKGI